MNNGKRILVVDDDEEFIINLTETLVGKGYEVLTAMSGRKALEMAGSRKPDIVLLDETISGMSGYEVCRSIKDDPELDNTGIIFIMEKRLPPSKMEELELSVDDFMTKPIHYDDLFARIRSISRIQAYRKRLSTMVKFSNALNVLNVDDLVNTLNSGLTEIFQVELFSVFLYDESVRTLRLFAHNHPGGDEMADVEISIDRTPFMKTVIDEKRILFISDFSKSGFKVDPGREKYVDDYAMGVPLLIGGKVIGVLNLNGNINGFFDKPDFTLLRLGAEHIASSVSNAMQHSRIQEFAMKDGLTKLYNHRYFYERLVHEWERGQRYSEILSIILIDIDYFKKINDTYGHLSGDMVLRQLSDLITRHVRTVDIVARYGGEEFVAILPQTKKEAAVQVAERIRKDVEGTSFSGEKGDIRLTISAGVEDTTAGYVQKPEDVVRFADEKLYKAKKAGRNKVVA